MEENSAPITPQTFQESVLAASTADQAASREQDRLGFEPYVAAMASFLTNPVTKGPLTISIEGEWGSGKSSFMRQLKERLEELAADESKPEVLPLTVEFNAWRHDQSKALWAGFAIRFTHEVCSQISMEQRWLGHLKLLGLRFKWGQGWFDLARAVAMWAGIAAGGVYGAIYGFQWLEKAGAGAPGRIGLALAAGVALLKGLAALKETIGNPLEVQLKKHFEVPDYESQISFIEKFHEDFAEIVEAYARQRTVFVFIDDLDRCEVPKAAELMQALNLMMSGKQPNLVFILGMDRQKVAAGLAVNHKDVLDYLRAADRERPDSEPREYYGLLYGYTFIEKFIQLPFAVPEPKEEDVEQYLLDLSRPPVVGEHPRLGWWAQVWVRVRTRLRGTRREQWSLRRKAGVPKPSPATEEHRERIRLAVTKDSESFRSVVKSMAPWLGNNARRLKQFVNLFRLRVFIAVETGLLDDGALTLAKLGKLVALELVYPLFVAALENDQELVEAVRDTSKSGVAAVRWRQYKKLHELLKEPSGILEAEDVRRVFLVSKRVRTIDLSSPEELHKAAGVHQAAPDISGQATVSASADFKSVNFPTSESVHPDESPQPASLKSRKEAV